MGQVLGWLRSGLALLSLVFAIPVALGVLLAAVVIRLFGVGLSAALSRLGVG
jgi:hypothetical protein